MKWRVYYQGQKMDFCPHEIIIVKQFGCIRFYIRFYKGYDSQLPDLQIMQLDKKAVEEIVLDPTIPNDVKAKAMEMLMSGDEYVI